MITLPSQSVPQVEASLKQAFDDQPKREGRDRKNPES